MRSWQWAGLGAAAAGGVAAWFWSGQAPPAADQVTRAIAPSAAPAPAAVQAPARTGATTVSAAVTASSPSSRRPPPAWAELTLETPLADVLAAAQASGSPAALLTAVRLMGACTTARSWTEPRLAGINELRLSAMAPEHAASAAARQSGQSHRTMLRYCSALDGPAIQTLGESMRQRLMATPNTWRALAGQPPRPRGEAWPPDQYQAALLTLNDPAAQAATLETVLRLLTPPPQPGRAALNTYQADIVRVLVAQELTGDRHPLSAANTAACVQRAVCDVGNAGFAADPSNRLVIAATQHWVQLIRTQQWAAIGLVPGP